MCVVGPEDPGPPGVEDAPAFFALTAWVAVVALPADDSWVLLALLEELAPSDPEASACATPVAPASAAPTPIVTALAPSQRYVGV